MIQTTKPCHRFAAALGGNLCRTSLLIATAAGFLLLPACVTVNEKPKPSSAANRPATTGGQKPKLPDGPIARPAESANVTSARITVAIRPIGQISYDGMTLPVVSPSGTFLATQVGAAPSWDALLAKPGSFVPGSTRISAFSIPADDQLAAPGSKAALRPVSWKAQLPGGLLLGRSADDRGFLVESPRPDGARWIGRVSWITGTLEWLVQDGAINAFATLGPSGELIFCRGTAGGMGGGADGPFELVIRPNAASATGELVLRGRARDESYAFPLCGADRANVYALAYPNSGNGELQVVAVSLPGNTDTSIRPGTLGARDGLNMEGSLLGAFQAAAPMQTPWPSSGFDTTTKSWQGVALVSAGSRSVVWFAPDLGLSVLSSGTAAAVPLVVGPMSERRIAGLLLAAGRELVFQQMRTNASDTPGANLWSREASVLAGAYIPRVVSPKSEIAPQRGDENGNPSGITPQMRYVLMNPAKDPSGTVLGVSMMVPVPPIDEK